MTSWETFRLLFPGFYGFSFARAGDRENSCIRPTPRSLPQTARAPPSSRPSPLRSFPSRHDSRRHRPRPLSPAATATATTTTTDETLDSRRSVPRRHRPLSPAAAPSPSPHHR
ncbi:hypothetical protein DAI22_03g319750 [Oryza sativa Japonica Group]|nr:hypothetical protein DAI22_03g319750 [Oryza sativa Japonica Group]